MAKGKGKRSNILRTIFTKICGAFLGFIIIILGLAYGLYSVGIATIKGQLQKELSVQNANFSESLRTELERITLLQYDLINDWDLKKLTLDIPIYTDYEKSEMILNIKNRIVPIQTSSKLVQEIKVIIPAIDQYIGTRMVSQIDDHIRRIIDEYEKNCHTHILYHEGECMILISYPQLYNMTNRKMQFMLQTTLSERAINSYLREQRQKRDGSVFLVSEEQKMVIGEENEAFQEAVRNCIREKEVEEGKPHPEERKTLFLDGKIDGKSYFIVYTDIGFQDLRLVNCVAADAVFGELKNYRLWMMAFASVSVIAVFLFAIYIRKEIHQPLHELMEGFREVKAGNLDIRVEHRQEDEFRYIYDDFNDMLLRLNSLIDQQYKQKILIQKSELKQLQAQINPHFLFNSFLILSNRIDMGDMEFAADFSRQLGYFFRFITKNKSSIIPLKEEVEHACIYCNIQYVRFASRMDMERAELPEDCESIPVPRLILQPILENMFLYTLEVIDYRGFLKVSYEKNNEFLDIVFEDNGDTVSEEKLESMRKMLEEHENGETTALINIHERLRLAYDERCGLQFDRSSYGGIRVTVRILRDGDKMRWNDY